MATDPPGPSRAVQPHSGPQPAPGEAASPPTKASLKQWWRNFSKAPKQEANGRASHSHSQPCVAPATNFFLLHKSPISRFPTLSNWVEDVEDVQTILKRKEIDLRESSLEKEIKDSIDENSVELLVVHQWPYNGFRPPSKDHEYIDNVFPQEKALDLQRLLASEDDKDMDNVLPKEKALNFSHLLSSKDRKGTENVLPKEKALSIMQQPQGIFGVPLRQSIAYANVAISLVDSNGKSYIYGYVPIVVAKCGVFLKEKATNVEGIFRLSGSEKRIKELKTIFDSPDRYGKGLDWAGYTVHDAANLLRRYLNQLPEPIVPLNLYERFREPLDGHAQEAVGDADGHQAGSGFDVDKAIKTYQQLITELPPLNRQLLLYILDLLAVFASKSDENRMNSANLSAIFQPGMLSHPTHNMAPNEYRLSQDVLIFLIENQDHFLIGMRGTAADEQTVQEVQNGGTPPPGTPNTPGRKANVARSASNASAGADSVRKFGGVRRNVSVSSRHSRQSNGAPSPASPAYGVSLTNTTSGGVHRSNTVPSKRSPGLPGSRLQKNSGSPSPTAVGFTPSAAAPRGLSPAAVASEDRSFTSSSPGATPTALGISATSAASAIASQERLLAEPNNTSTPTKERNLTNLFQRSPTAETERKQPNKLRKKRIPGSSNPSAQSSTQSLHSQSHMASPPLQATRAATDLAESSPLEPISSETPAGEQNEATPPATTTPRADQPTNQFSIPRAENMHQASERTLKPTSPVTSLHSSSSFNDQSDADRHDEAMAAEEPREKRRLFRLSRHRDTSGPSLTPRKGLGSDAGAGASATSIGSAKPRKSWTGETVPAGSDATLVGAHLHSSNETDHAEEKKGPLGRLWDKVRENKEEREAKKERNKSPPGSHERLASTLPRGKSMDASRSERLDLDGPSTPRAQQAPR